MKSATYVIDTAMGSVQRVLGHPLPFLTETEQVKLDEIGYTGKLNGKPISRLEYLNSLGKGTFSMFQTKWDNGDFRERFVISRAY